MYYYKNKHTGRIVKSASKTPGHTSLLPCDKEGNLVPEAAHQSYDEVEEGGEGDKGTGSQASGVVLPTGGSKGTDDPPSGGNAPSGSSNEGGSADDDGD